MNPDAPEAPRKPEGGKRLPMPSLMEKLVLEPLKNGELTVREEEEHPANMEELVMETLGDKEMTLMEIGSRIILPLADEAETENLVRIAGAVWNLRGSGKIRRDEKTQKYGVING